MGKICVKLNDSLGGGLKVDLEGRGGIGRVPSSSLKISLGVNFWFFRIFLRFFFLKMFWINFVEFCIF